MPIATRLKFLVVVSFLFATTIRADDSELVRSATERQARTERIEKLEKRIRATEPRPRNGPARKLNISDDEVREIEYAVHDVLPHTIVSISTVVTGCPCEEGPQCKDQVWLAATKGDKTYELQLSHVNNQWIIGAIQGWWLKRKQLKPFGRDWSSYQAYRKTYEELVESFPVCSETETRSSSKK